MHFESATLIARVCWVASLAGCVTINIYFPAAAAERAADRIIDEVWQLKPDAAKPPSGKPGATQ